MAVVWLACQLTNWVAGQPVMQPARQPARHVACWLASKPVRWSAGVRHVAGCPGQRAGWSASRSARLSAVAAGWQRSQPAGELAGGPAGWLVALRFKAPEGPTLFSVLFHRKGPHFLIYDSKLVIRPHKEPLSI